VGHEFRAEDCCCRENEIVDGLFRGVRILGFGRCGICGAGGCSVTRHAGFAGDGRLGGSGKAFFVLGRGDGDFGLCFGRFGVVLAGTAEGASGVAADLSDFARAGAMHDFGQRVVCAGGGSDGGGGEVCTGVESGGGGDCGYGGDDVAAILAAGPFGGNGLDGWVSGVGLRVP